MENRYRKSSKDHKISNNCLKRQAGGFSWEWKMENCRWKRKINL